MNEIHVTHVIVRKALDGTGVKAYATIILNGAIVLHCVAITERGGVIRVTLPDDVSIKGRSLRERINECVLERYYAVLMEG